MNIRGLIFDINGTLIDIRTDESYDDIYRVVSNFLSYQGVLLSSARVRELYFKAMKDQLKESRERYPEFDAVAIFREMLNGQASDYTLKLPAEKLTQLPHILAEVYRSVSRFKLLANSRTTTGRSSARRRGKSFSPKATRYVSAAISVEISALRPGRCTLTTT